jgi:hypothetical protein
MTRRRCAGSLAAGKGLAGLDQHQVRRWRSWYRWTTLVMVARTFLAVLAAAERARRPTTARADRADLQRTPAPVRRAARPAHRRSRPPAALVGVAAPTSTPRPRLPRPTTSHPTMKLTVSSWRTRYAHHGRDRRTRGGRDARHRRRPGCGPLLCRRRGGRPGGRGGVHVAPPPPDRPGPPAGGRGGRSGGCRPSGRRCLWTSHCRTTCHEAAWLVEASCERCCQMPPALTRTAWCQQVTLAVESGNSESSACFHCPIGATHKR